MADLPHLPLPRLVERQHLRVLPPVDGWLSTHITTKNLAAVQLFDHGRMRTAASVVNYALGLFTSFDFTQQLLFPLNLEDHLAVDVLDVEVLASHDQSAVVAYHVVQSVVACSQGVLVQAVVVPSRCLLQAVDSLGRLNLA